MRVLRPARSARWCPRLVDFATPAGQVDNVTDVDAGALMGIAVTAADTTNGTWFYSHRRRHHLDGRWARSSDTSARLLAADANNRLYFQPTANFNGTLATAITFRAWDQTSGTDGSTRRHHHERRHHRLLDGDRHREPGDQPRQRRAGGGC